jgi:isopenicillin-N N-acyltransferase-like protein
MATAPLVASGQLADLTRTAVAAPTPSGEIPAPLTIRGRPRDRGREYGKRFADDIKQFVDREIYQAFIQKPSPKDELLRYAGACGKVVREVSPIVHDEMEGIAEGTGLRLEEVLLLSLHEELYHRGVLPKVPHCTAVAVAPPETADGRTLVGQTWDWMESVFGLSRIVHWRRDEGPSLLAYGYPGLWVGAGLNSAGLALTWTSAGFGKQSPGVRVGVPSYALLTHLLYQESLEAAISEAKRNKHAGWFTFVLGDGKGNLVNIEGSPERIAIEPAKHRLVRIGFGSRQMTGTPADQPVALHARCQKMYGLLGSASGKVDIASMQRFFADPKCEISVGKPTIDMMVFDTTNRTAYLSRGPSYKVDWRKFTFDEN